MAETLAVSVGEAIARVCKQRDLFLPGDDDAETGPWTFEAVLRRGVPWVRLSMDDPENGKLTREVPWASVRVRENTTTAPVPEPVVSAG